MKVLLTILSFLSFYVLSGSLEKIDDSIHYYVSFTNDASIIENVPSLKSEINSASDMSVKITSRNNEKFVCKLPLVTEEESKVEDYTGPTAPTLMETMLYNEKMCSYLIDIYWTYQVCHGRFIIQYHENKILSGQLSRTEYYLGNFDASLSLPSDSVSPPTRRIENEDYPYYLVKYTHGTNCDVTGKPRTADVVYICVEKVQHKILSITEVSSCHYEVIIMTDLLCKHPRYQLSEKKDHKILCWNEDAKKEDEAKPKVLQRLDDFHDSTFKREYTVNSETLPEEEGHVIDGQSFESMANAGKSGYVLSGEKKFEPRESLANNPAVVRHTVNRILTGEDCIVGGIGWWKYEFCYGKHVIQFHENSNGERSEILLGSYDEVIHKEWVKQSKSSKAPVKDNNQIIQVSHLYSKGDLCDETGAHRDVEVRIRCATADHSALAFSMQLTEPNTCQYVLMIDSERFCEPLQYADNFGLIEISPTARSYSSQRTDSNADSLEISEEMILNDEMIHREL